MKSHKSIFFLMIGCLIALPSALSYAEEPRRPNFDHVFNAEKEAKISRVSGFSSEQVFERLKSIDFFIDEEMMEKAIFKAYRHRRGEGIDLALYYLTMPEREVYDGDLINRSQDHYVAKEILKVFPHAAVNKLVELYENGDSITRGNILQAIGKMAGGRPIRELLINALNDKTFYYEEDSEIDGEFLRICDLAYNQLVFRYNIKDVLRNIGYSNKIDMRDYHIGILQSMF